MKFYLAFILDVIFCTFLSFVTSFVLLNYFLNRTFAIIFAICITIPVSIIAYKRLFYKRESFNLTKKEQLAMNATCACLNLYTKTQQLCFFQKALTKSGAIAERKKNGLFFKNCAVFPLFSYDGVSKTDIVRIFNDALSKDKIYILSQAFLPEIKNFINRFGGKIVAVSGQEIYKYLKENDSLPPQKFAFVDERPLSDGAYIAFLGRKKSKNYFALGLFFFFMSYLVPIKIYYVLCGCAFLILSLICKLFGKTPSTN